jgi:hypothetical protein
MKPSNEVREHCRVHYIEPTRARGESTIAIRAGTVHSDLGYKNRLPLVCAAIGAKVFEEACRLERIGVVGPLNGASTTFTFRLL